MKKEFEYYYRTTECKAKGSKSPDCICWHDEGTGLFADSKQEDKEILDFGHETPHLEWRIKK